MKANVGKVLLVVGVVASAAIFILRRYLFKGRYVKAMSIFSGVTLVITGLTRAYSLYRMLRADRLAGKAEKKTAGRRPRRRRSTSRRRTATRRTATSA